MNFKNLLTSRGVKAVSAFVAAIILVVVGYFQGKGVQPEPVIDSGKDVIKVLNEDEPTNEGGSVIIEEPSGEDESIGGASVPEEVD